MIIEKSSSSLGLAMIDFILTKTASINTYSISKDCLVVSTFGLVLKYSILILLIYLIRY